MVAKRTSEFFNRDTALILFFSNGLRFLYWFYEPWEPYLLGQAVAVFSVQFALATLSFHYDRANNEKIGFTVKKYRSRNIRYYFAVRKIKDARDFFTALAGFGLVMLCAFAALVALFGHVRVCTAVIVVANLTDTLVSIPQFIQIVVRRNIEGASVVLVVQFLSGDWMKLGMFWITGTAWPFLFGAIVQICVDSTVAASFFWQKRKRRPLRVSGAQPFV
jgi:hypothetical protein